MGSNERHDDVEVRLKAALDTLSAAETRLAELAREATQTRFEIEDAQVRHATAQMKVKRGRRVGRGGGEGGETSLVFRRRKRGRGMLPYTPSKNVCRVPALTPAGVTVCKEGVTVSHRPPFQNCVSFDYIYRAFGGDMLYMARDHMDGLLCLEKRLGRGEQLAFT